MAKRIAVLSLALGLMVAVTIVVAQPGQGGRGGRFRGGMPLMGKVTAANIAGGTIDLEVFGRNITVYPVQATRLTKFETIGLADLQVGDTIEVSGTPLKVLAAQVRAPLPAAQPAAQPGGPGGGPGGGRMMMFGGGGGSVVSGTVKSLEPLVVSMAPLGGQGEPTDVEITTSADTKVSREVAANWDEITAGTYVRATGEMNDRQQTVLQTLTIDPDLAAVFASMPTAPGGGPGGPGGGPGF